MKIAIVGLAIPHPTGKELKKKGYTVWTLGRNADPDCDRYYELHGLQTKHPEKLVRRNLHSVVYGMCEKEGLPLNCSACGMALETLLEKDVEEVLITGCPQDSQEEYIKERPALAMVVGYLKGVRGGQKIFWENAPENLKYGKQK
jgi:hypothetical protein